MSIKVFATNNLGKIEFDRTSLEKLLNEIYEEGFRAGAKYAKDNYWTWYPSITTTPYYSGINDTTSITNKFENPCTTTSTTAATANSDKNINTFTSEKVCNKVEPKMSITVNGKPIEYSNAKELLSNIEESFNKVFDSSKKANTAFTTLAKEIANL